MAVYKILTEKGVPDAGQEALLTELAAELGRPGAKVLLHLHGGLVAEAAGLAIADRLSGAVPNGWALGPEWTQVFVVWRTGAIESLRQDWESVVTDDRLYQTLLRRLLTFVARKLAVPIAGGRGAGRSAIPDDNELLLRITGQLEPERPLDQTGPEAQPEPGARAATFAGASDNDLAGEFRDELEADDEFQAALADIDAVVNARAEGRGPAVPAIASRGQASFDNLSSEVRAELTAAAPDGVARRGPVSVATFLLEHAAVIAFNCFQRFRTHRDHGLHATVVEELCRELYGDLVGVRIWGLMVKHAADHFAAGGYGNNLVDQLVRQPPVKMVVTAHSAGSIWASHLLLAMKAAEAMRPIDLYLLAPAVRQTLFATAVANAGELVGSCRMLTMRDELERADAVLGKDKAFIYPSSLLYLVSGLFEEAGSKAYVDAPLLGMARFVDAGWLTAAEAEANQTINAFFGRAGKGIVFSTEDDVTLATSHGAFDSEAVTLATVRALFSA